jgi:rubrerythrin
MKTHYTGEDALKIGIQVEIDARNAYLHGVKTVDDSGSKAILQSLAEEEGQHRKHLEGLYRETFGKRLLNVNLHRYYKARRIIEEDLNPLRVLEFAMREEREHYRFFEGLLACNTDPDGRKMFQRLMAEEEQHLELLKTEYQIRKKERPRRRRRRKSETIAA